METTNVGEWRRITPTLSVSSLGYIKKKHPRLGFLKPFIPAASTGDRRKFMHRGKTYFLAREVCRAFHGEPDATKRHTVDHINRDCLDDRAVNLRWASKEEQAANRTWTTERKTADKIQTSLPGEVWKVTACKKRRISNLGRAQFMNSASKTKWNPITTPKPCRGQKYATITNEKFHRLVATLFLQPPTFKNATVDHINGDCTDNRAANLRWASRSLQNRNRKRKVNTESISIPVELHCDSSNTWKKFSSCQKAAWELTNVHNTSFWGANIKRSAMSGKPYHGLTFRFA
jgi:hypothetical protein